MQIDPDNPAKGQLEARLGAPVGNNAMSIIRRYELFEYIGPYDPENHEALMQCDSNPLKSELGIYLGAQNGALNLVPVVAPVPLPAPVWLLGSALLGVAGIARQGGHGRKPAH